MVSPFAPLVDVARHNGNMLTSTAVHLGLGRHITDTANPHDGYIYLKIAFATGLLSPCCITATRLSFLFFYWRLFGRVFTAAYRAVFYVLAAVTATWLVYCVSASLV